MPSFPLGFLSKEKPPGALIVEKKDGPQLQHILDGEKGAFESRRDEEHTLDQMIAFRSSKEWIELMVHIPTSEGISNYLIDWPEC